MVFGEVLSYGEAILADEQQAMAVFISLHLITSANPASFLGFLCLVRVEIARTQGFAEFVLMQR
jgi:hypothetical protein